MEPLMGSRTLTSVMIDTTLTPEVWAGVRDGDTEAFVEVYEATARAVFGFCLRRTGSWETAEDCTSLIYLEAWRLRRTLRSETSGMAWLFGVSHNVVRNSVRARRRHRALLLRLPLHEESSSFEGDSSERVDAEQRIRQLRDALAVLAPRDREILTLAASADLTTVDLAQALGIPVGTAKSRLARARQRLAAAAERSSNTGPSQAALED